MGGVMEYLTSKNITPASILESNMFHLYQLCHWKVTDDAINYYIQLECTISSIQYCSELHRNDTGYL